MSDIDWYDKCQTAEAELLLARADNERLRAELGDLISVGEQISVSAEQMEGLAYEATCKITIRCKDMSSFNERLKKARRALAGEQEKMG